jgi:alkanesulfonate monooxygenase SsuD/methylene tetrahydromethanopterin reductase-like flavin-dependent oxidoreductase (luciferase family)
MTAMHFGLFSLMTQRERGKRAREIMAETVEHVRLVEQIGFEIAWFAEHHFSNYCLCPSPLTLCTYMAPQTSRIRLGPAVIVVPLYERVRLLEDIGMADQLSDGRLVLGFGTGYQEYEFHKFGVDLKQARAVFLETLDYLERFLAGDPVSFEGQFVRMPETYFSVRPIQKRPDIYIAGMAADPETQGRAVRNGYVPFFTTGWNTLEAIAQMREKARETFVAAGGKANQAPFAMQRYVMVTDDKAEALKAAEGARYIRRIAMSMRNRYGQLEGAYLKEIPAPDEPPLEEIADRLLIGDPERVAEKLAREIDVLQPTHISCFMAIPGIEQKRVLRSIERFGTEVMPLLTKRFGDLSRIGVPAGSRPA